MTLLGQIQSDDNASEQDRQHYQELRDNLFDVYCGNITGEEAENIMANAYWNVLCFETFGSTNAYELDVTTVLTNLINSGDVTLIKFDENGDQEFYICTD